MTVQITCPNFVGMGHTRQTALKSTGGHGLPDKTYHVMDSSERGHDKRPTTGGDLVVKTDVRSSGGVDLTPDV
jgi:hypothetical protein